MLGKTKRYDANLILIYATLISGTVKDLSYSNMYKSLQSKKETFSTHFNNIHIYNLYFRDQYIC